MVCQRWCVTKCHTASPVPQVPCLPHKTKVDVAKLHACHAKRRWMSPSATLATPATPATQSGAPPRATKARPSAPPAPAQCPKCHACHVKRRWMSASATAATRNKVGCQQVPCLPRDMKVDVAKCHAGHAKWRGAPTRADPVPQCHACHAKRRWMSPSATPATQFCRWCVKDGV